MRPGRLPSFALAAAVAILLAACQPTLGSFWQPVAAKVGQDQITEETLNAEVEINASQLGNLFQGPDSNLARLTAKQTVLGQLIQQVGLEQEAPSLGISVTPAAVAQAVAQIRQHFGSPAAYQSALSTTGITEADLATDQRLSLISSGVFNAVTKNLNATPDQIAAYYQANQQTYTGSYNAAEILICSNLNPATGTCTPGPGDAALAQQVDQKAINGGDFTQLAAQYSADTSNKGAGGDLGWQTPGTLPADFETAALALQPGQVSAQPLTTGSGYFIIKLLGKGEPLSAASASINTTLEQTARQQAFVTYRQRVLAKLGVEVNPQFGNFDASSLAVVPPPGAVPSPGANAAAGQSVP